MCQWANQGERAEQGVLTRHIWRAIWPNLDGELGAVLSTIETCQIDGDVLHFVKMASISILKLTGMATKSRFELPKRTRRDRRKLRRLFVEQCVVDSNHGPAFVGLKPSGKNQVARYRALFENLLCRYPVSCRRSDDSRSTPG